MYNYLDKRRPHSRPHAAPMLRLFLLADRDSISGRRLSPFVAARPALGRPATKAPDFATDHATDSVCPLPVLSVSVQPIVAHDGSVA